MTVIERLSKRRFVALKPEFESSNILPRLFAPFHATMSGEHLSVQSTTQQQGLPGEATRGGRGGYGLRARLCVTNTQRNAGSSFTNTYTTHGPRARSLIQSRTSSPSARDLHLFTRQQKKNKNKHALGSPQSSRSVKMKKCFFRHLLPKLHGISHKEEDCAEGQTVLSHPHHHPRRTNPHKSKPPAPTPASLPILLLRPCFTW